MAYVLITGASSGIGEEFARSFAKKYFDLILVSRNIEKLEELKKELTVEYKIKVETLSIDLTGENACKELYDYTKKNNLGISVLVNNAGFGEFGSFIESDIDKLKKMVDLNDKALMELCYYFAKDMKNEHFGHIVNVASIGGFMPGPYMAVYYASKAFVLNFSLALKEELKEYGIAVTTLCPGPVKTPFWDKMGVKMSGVKALAFARSSKQVVKSAITKYENGGGLIIDGFINNLAVLGVKLAPSEISAMVVSKLQKKLNK